MPDHVPLETRVAELSAAATDLEDRAVMDEASSTWLFGLIIREMAPDAVDRLVAAMEANADPHNADRIEGVLNALGR